jgi:outer membrane receptor for ferrienterochelin and colicins
LHLFIFYIRRRIVFKHSKKLKGILHRGMLILLLIAARSGWLQAQPDSVHVDNSLDSLLNIMVSATSKYEQSSQDAPASITVITREEIQQYGYSDISEVLGQVRDLYLSYDRNYTYVGVRGISRSTDYNNRLAVLINGSVLNEHVWGAGPILELNGINIDDVERIEVVRGPTSSLYGSSPMLGVINIVTHTKASLDKIRATVSGGSFGRAAVGFTAGRSFKNGVDLNIGFRFGRVKGQELYYPEYDDSSTNNGIAAFRDYQKFGGITAKLTYKGFSFQSLMSNLDIGVPTGAYETAFDTDAHNLNQFGLWEVRHEKAIRPKLTLSTSAALNHFRYLGYNPNEATGTMIDIDGGTSLYATGEARLRWDTHANHRLVAGLEYSRNLIARFYQDTSFVNAFKGSFPYSTYAAFLQDEWEISPRFTLALGARADRLYQQLLAFSPRAALLYYPANGTVVKAIYGQAFRSPTIYEFNADDGVFTKSNPNLKSERINTAEINLEQRLARSLQLRATVFYTAMSGLIDQVPDEEGVVQYQNAGLANGYGSSGELILRSGQKLSGYANYTYQHMRGQDGSLLTNSPIHLAKAGISWRLAKHFRFSPEAQYRDRSVIVQGGYAPSYLLLNANLAFEPAFQDRAKWMNGLRLNIKVRNILNTVYSYGGGFEHLMPTIQQDGRNFEVRLRVDLF